MWTSKLRHTRIVKLSPLCCFVPIPMLYEMYPTPPPGANVYILYSRQSQFSNSELWPGEDLPPLPPTTSASSMNHYLLVSDWNVSLPALIFQSHQSNAARWLCRGKEKKPRSFFASFLGNSDFWCCSVLQQQQKEAAALITTSTLDHSVAISSFSSSRTAVEKSFQATLHFYSFPVFAREFCCVFQMGIIFCWL